MITNYNFSDFYNKIKSHSNKIKVSQRTVNKNITNQENLPKAKTPDPKLKKIISYLLSRLKIIILIIIESYHHYILHLKNNIKAD